MPRAVAILCFDHCQSLDVTGPLEVFAGAARAQLKVSRTARYAAEVVSLSGKAVTSSSGLGLVPARSLAQALRRGVDTLIVAGGEGARRAVESEEVARAVRRAAGQVRRVASVCTGAFVLAAAGLLDGRRVTTHFAFCDELAARFPALTVDPDPIYVREGAVWTSAGVTAGIDLSLALVEEDYGAELALVVARHLVVFVRRAGGQSQFSTQLAAQTGAPGPIRELLSWIAEHPRAELTVPELARRAHMSLRNFSRVFRREVGVAPAEYVERMRVEAARRALETTELAVEAVAAEVGFGTPEGLRRAFARSVALSPREYRARFGRRQAS